MSKIAELFKNKWMSLKEIELENGEKYTYTSEVWCDSEGVAILPYRLNHKYLDIKVPEFLGKYETYPHHSESVELYSITGGIEKKGESPVFTAKRVLAEETGYDVPVEKLVYLGEIIPSKTSDKSFHLFAVDVEGFTKQDSENNSSIVLLEELSNAKDPLLHAMFVRAVEKGLF